MILVAIISRKNPPSVIGQKYQKYTGGRAENFLHLCGGYLVNKKPMTEPMRLSMNYLIMRINGRKRPI